ncbi:hypothetical protein ACSBOB_27050 [Mesorhizobium sp. ASY16-5R]|uniref:hypothetical protein n=1 Tax=Mesorhizobium sp. ASY16-5R TaxID=3445772 RepID=UPI003FA17169
MTFEDIGPAPGSLLWVHGRAMEETAKLDAGLANMRIMIRYSGHPSKGYADHLARNFVDEDEDEYLKGRYRRFEFGIGPSLSAKRAGLCSVQSESRLKN